MTNDEVYKLIEANGLTLHGDIEHFAALVAEREYERGVIDGRQIQMQSSVDKAVNAMSQRNDVLEEVAKEIEKMKAFEKDTMASFAAYIRGMKR